MAKRRLQVLPGGEGGGDGGDSGKFDPWKFVDQETGYSKEKFYLSTKNTHDHSEQLSVRMAPDFIARLRGFVAESEMPYESPQDFIRDSVVHRLHDLVELSLITDPEWREWVAVEKVNGTVERRRRYIEAQSNVVENIRTYLQQAQSMRDETGYQQTLEDAKLLVVTLREPFAGNLRSVIEQFDK